MASIAMSDDETEFKRELWMAENHDWVAKQEGRPQYLFLFSRVLQLFLFFQFLSHIANTASASAKNTKKSESRKVCLTD